MAFTGDGGTSEGDFHEALNVAAVWQLPVIFIIENNAYGLSTPANEQYRCKDLADRALGYGMEAEIIDGNSILDVHGAISRWAAELRKNPRPVLLEMKTFRMRGHEEASGTKYVPKDLMDEWAKKDPLLLFEKLLTERGLLNKAMIAEMRLKHKQAIDKGIEEAFAQPEPEYDLAEELADVYAPTTKLALEGREPEEGSEKKEMRLVDAIQDGLRQAMEIYPNLILMGQDIAEYGGVFKITEGFVESFGKGRVRNTPLCESAILGTALGLSLKGKKAMMEMQFADFATVGFNQIVNNLAKLHWRWGAKADVVVRMPTGAGVGAGPFHSQSNEAWFVHTPGLKVVYPSNPYDAKGLLLSSFEDCNPVIFFEHKALYRSVSGDVPTEPYYIEIGKAKVVREGTDMVVITYGAGVHWAMEATKQLGNETRVEILDLRTLLPWDKDAVRASVLKTGKVLVMHEDSLTGGIGGEIAAWIGEHCFNYLDAPVMREAAYDTPIPFAPSLEKDFLSRGRVAGRIEELLSW